MNGKPGIKFLQFVMKYLMGKIFRTQGFFKTSLPFLFLPFWIKHINLEWTSPCGLHSYHR